MDRPSHKQHFFMVSLNFDLFLHCTFGWLLSSMKRPDRVLSVLNNLPLRHTTLEQRSYGFPEIRRASALPTFSISVVVYTAST